MAEFPALRLWTDAYIADTQHLTNEEHGVYLRLIMFAWRTPSCSLPDDDKRLSRMVGMSLKKWSSIKPSIMSFWKLADGEWTQKRLTKEREFVEKNVAQKRYAGEASARAKLLKNNNVASTAVPEPLQRLVNNPYPYPETNKNISPSLHSGEARARKKATRMPDDFMPDLEFAISEGMTWDQAVHESKAIRDWSKSSPNGAKLDWPATWRGWIRRKVNETAQKQKPDTTLKALDRMIENERREPSIFDALKTIDHEDHGASRAAAIVRIPANAARY